MSKSLPIVIQTIVYRRAGGAVEVLILKRNEQRGGFWNVVNGTLEINESVIACRSRELMEEVGISEVLYWGDEIHRFHFPYKDYEIVVLVYSAEVRPDQSVVINEEHTEYKWVPVAEAIATAKFDDDKKGLQMFQNSPATKES